MGLVFYYVIYCELPMLCKTTNSSIFQLKFFNKLFYQFITAVLSDLDILCSFTVLNTSCFTHPLIH